MTDPITRAREALAACDVFPDGMTATACRSALRDLLAIVEAEPSEPDPVKGVQAWMSLDLSSALGHDEMNVENGGERSWSDWWALPTPRGES